MTVTELKDRPTYYQKTGTITWRTFVTFAVAIFIGFWVGVEHGKVKSEKAANDRVVEMQKEVFDYQNEALRNKPDTSDPDFYNKLRQQVR